MAVKKPLVLYTDTVKEIAASDSIAGAVVSGSVDNAALRADGTGGSTSQGSAVVISDYTTSTQNNVGLTADDGATANIGLFLSPKGTGALTAQRPDGTATGGNARGLYAVDKQLLRTAATQVASGDYATISGGYRSTASGTNAAVGGGEGHIASGYAATIPGGYVNVASAEGSTVGGGVYNKATGLNSTILGGRGLTVSGIGSFGVIGSNDTPAADSMTVSENYVGVIANVDIVVANNDNTARGIRWYEPQSSTGVFPATGIYYTKIIAQAQSANITYKLPTGAPASNGMVLTSQTDGTWSWVALSAGAYTIASKAEVLTGTDNEKAITPEGLTALYGNGGTISTAPSGVATLGSGGGYFNVSGAITVISDIDFDNAAIGRLVWLVFTGACTLTHNATTFILPGGGDIVAGAGDMGAFIAETSENVRCVNFIRASGATANQIVKALASDHVTVSTHTTGTEVSLGATLATGTYTFQFFLLGQSSATATALRFGINFTGTAAVRHFTLRYPTSGTTAANATAATATPSTTALHESHTSDVFSTTAPNLGGAAVVSANLNTLYVIEGVIVVTASGDLELWHGSETNNATTIKANSSLIVTKVA